MQELGETIDGLDTVEKRRVFANKKHGRVNERSQNPVPNHSEIKKAGARAQVRRLNVIANSQS